MKMTPRFYKHKILLDENFPNRSFFPSLNSKFTIKHIAKELKHSGWSDDQIYKFAQKEKMVIVTFNIKDFAEFVDISHTTGIVGVSSNLSNEDIDKKLTALFTKNSEKSLFGKITHITGESKSKSKKES